MKDIFKCHLRQRDGSRVFVEPNSVVSDLKNSKSMKVKTVHS